MTDRRKRRVRDREKEVESWFQDKMKDIESSDQLFVTLKMMYLDEQEWQEMKSKCYKEVKTEMRLCMYEGYVVVGTLRVRKAFIRYVH